MWRWQPFRAANCFEILERVSVRAFLVVVLGFFSIVIHHLEAINCKCNYCQRKRRGSQTNQLHVLLLYTNKKPTPTCDIFLRIGTFSTTDGLPQVTGYHMPELIKWQVMCIHCHFNCQLLYSTVEGSIWSHNVWSCGAHFVWALLFCTLRSLSGQTVVSYNAISFTSKLSSWSKINCISS